VGVEEKVTVMINTRYSVRGSHEGVIVYEDGFLPLISLLVGFGWLSVL